MELLNLPSELLLVILNFVSDNVSLISAMQTCRFMKQLVDRNEAFWFERQVRPPNGSLEEWQRWSHHGTRKAAAEVPLIVVPALRLNSIFINRGKQSYVSRYVRSLCPPCMHCHLPNSIYCIWPGPLCFNCFKDPNVMRPFDMYPFIADTSRNRLAARLKFFLPADDVETIFHDDPNNVNECHLIEAAIQKYDSLEAILDVAAERRERYLYIQHELSLRGVVMRDDSLLVANFIEQGAINQACFESIVSSIEEASFLHSRTCYKTLKVLNFDRINAEEESIIAMQLNDEHRNVIREQVRSKWRQLIKADAYMLYFLQQNPYYQLCALRDCCPTDRFISGEDLQRQFENKFEDRVDFHRVFPSAISIIQKHDGDFRLLTLANDNMICRSDCKKLVAAVPRRNVVVEILLNQHLDIDENAWPKEMFDFVYFSVPVQLDEVAKSHVAYCSDLRNEIEDIIQNYANNQPMTLNEIEQVLTIHHFPLRSPNDLHRCALRSFQLTTINGEEMFSLPSSSIKLVVPMDVVDANDDYGNASEDDEYEAEDHDDILL